MFKKLSLLLPLCLLITFGCKDEEPPENPPVDTFDLECCKIPPVEECLDGAHIFIPNAFTPNADGFSDVFRPYTGSGVQQIKSIKITNQANNVLFEAFSLLPNDISSSWGGQSNNGQIVDGIYNYEITITTISGMEKTYLGEVCSRTSFPTTCLENNRDRFCAFGTQHNGDGRFNFNLPNGEPCQ